MIFRVTQTVGGGHNIRTSQDYRRTDNLLPVRLQVGDEFVILSQNERWYQIQINGVTGWIYRTNVLEWDRLAPPATISLPIPSPDMLSNLKLREVIQVLQSLQDTAIPALIMYYEQILKLREEES